MIALYWNQLRRAIGEVLQDSAEARIALARAQAPTGPASSYSQVA
jgi:hypothetical protein